METLNTKSIQNTFLKGWTEADFKAVKRTITNHFKNRATRTAHQTDYLRYHSFSMIDSYFGLAYTSSSDYAGYWICNTEVYFDEEGKYKYIGFAANMYHVFAILQDAAENELIIRL